MESENTKAFSIGGDTNMTLWSGGDQSKAFDFQRVQSPLQETVIDTLGFYRYSTDLTPCYFHVRISCLVIKTLSQKEIII